MIDIDYAHAVDFEHCQTMDEARKRLSEITNLLNRFVMIRHSAKNKIMLECSKYPDMSKLSWDNKIIELLFLSGRSKEIIELIETFNKADEAYCVLRNKQNQVVEDLLALKKIIEVTPK